MFSLRSLWLSSDGGPEQLELPRWMWRRSDRSARAELVPSYPAERRWLRAGLAATVAASVVIPFVVAADVGAAASTVTVQRGQTLSQIAAELHTTVSALAAANGLSNPNLIFAGSVLNVPQGAVGSGGSGGSGGTVITVAPGQNLTSIAAHYGVTVAALVAANGIKDPNRVFAGSKLRIPAATGFSGGMALSSFSVPAELASHSSRLALRPDFVHAASAYGVPLPLLEALCWWESGWQTSIVSPTGAIGVCQVEPFTADFVNASLGTNLNPNTAGQNIDLGAAYLHSLLAATGGNQSLAVAGYYQGLYSVRASGMFPSTVTYVHGILAYAAIFGR